MVIFLLTIIYLFKSMLGFEKNHREYVKDVVLELTVFIVLYIIIYNLFGLLVGFTIKGVEYEQLIPYVLYIILRELLRYNMLQKSEKSKILIGLSILFFIILDLSYCSTLILNNTEFSTAIYLFMILLPLISTNISLSYLSVKSGYIPVIYYAAIMSIYQYLVPVIPNTALAATTAINFTVPILLWVHMDSYYDREKYRENNKRNNMINLSILVFPMVIILMMMYFTTGLFRYESIAVGTSSMEPIIYKGDIVIVDKKMATKKIEIGEIIAYKKGNVVMIQKITKRVKEEETYYYYVEEDEPSPIPEQDVIGTIHFKIKYLGWPSIWLEEGDKDE